MSELKPCPKCSLNGAPLRRIGEMDEYRVECVECYTVKTPWFKTLKEAEAYWNAFAEGMEQQASRIAELEAERDRLREALNEFLDLESPYSLLQVMETLSDAAELLLNQYGYDGPEYELIQHAIDHGKGIREKATVQRKLMGQTICQN